jgi:hypothetical protein
MFAATTSGTAGFLLNNLGDVTTNYPTNGQVLKYNSGTSIWEAGQVDLGNSQLQNLSDVNSGMMLTNGNVLTYDTTSAKWTSSAPGGGGGASYAILEPTGYNTAITASAGTLTGWAETYDPDSIVQIDAGSGSGSDQFQLAAGTYIIRFSSTGFVASGSVSTNSKANTGGIFFEVYDQTATTTEHKYYQEGMNFWTGNSSYWETGSGTIYLEGKIAPTVTSNYSIKYGNSGMNKQFNAYGSPGKPFRIVITKIA